MTIAEVLSGGRRWHIEQGDNRAVLATLPPDSIDAVVCDPPYELGFMGRAWDATGIAYDIEMWRAVLRVLKPGGHLVAFGGTRTYHRMTCVIEDAGFRIRDCLTWLYGSGFPKSLDVSKALDKAAGAMAHEGHSFRVDGGVGTASYKPTVDSREYQRPEPLTAEAKQWLGWGTALKPAHEPAVLARKPLAGTVAANVLAHGTGALNIDGCRVGSDGGTRGSNHAKTGLFGVGGRADIEPINAGRWPANVVLTHHDECNCVGTKRVRGGNFAGHPEGHRNAVYGKDHRPRAPSGYASEDGMETVEAWECVEDCPVRMLDEQSGTSASVGQARNNSAFKSVAKGADRAHVTFGHTESGGASRFFYTAKASTSERERGLEHRAVRRAHDIQGRKEGSAGSVHGRAGITADRANIHPTVKPVDLMRWLVRLVTRPGGIVLDPFAGSGSTCIAALAEGMRTIGIELDAEHVAIARDRIVGDAPLLNREARCDLVEEEAR